MTGHVLGNLPEPSAHQWWEQAEQVGKLLEQFEPVFDALHWLTEQAEGVIAVDNVVFGELAVVETEDLVGLLAQANACVRGAERVVRLYERQVAKPDAQQHRL